MKRIERFINLLQEILLEIEKEKFNSNSLWRIEMLENVIEPEMDELLKYALKGEFKYNKKQRRLASTYFILDEVALITNKTLLKDKILELQILYEKL